MAVLRSLVFLACLLCGCIAATAATAAPAPAPARPGADTLAGNPHATPPRLVTLAPNATELVYAAGAGPDIVGTVVSSDYPAAARALPRVGDGIQFSTETIVSLRPTLVIAWQPTRHTRALARHLRKLGVPVLYTDPKSLLEIPALVRLLGRRLNTQDTANATARQMERRIDALRAPEGPPTTVFLEVGDDPLYTLGKDPLINDILERCGGINIYGHSAVAAPQVSVESVLHKNPQAIILSPTPRTTRESRRHWWAAHGLAAARQGRVYAIPADWLHRPGPRLIDAAELICKDLR